jgi:phosphoribosylaminoimidazole-succinocarboxamide synthase
LNNLISEFIFTYLGNNNIPNHFIERLSPREQLIKKVEIIPIEVVVRNIAAGTFSKSLELKKEKICQRH